MNTALIKLQRKGQMVIPRSLREQVGVSEGALMEVAVVEGGRLLITPQITIDRAIVADPKKGRKQLLQELSAVVSGIRREAKALGLEKMTTKEASADVVVYRRKRSKKKASRSSK